MREIIVLSTTDTMELAQRIASALVEANEAACVSIIRDPLHLSMEGRVCDEGEVLLIIKSSRQGSKQ